MEPAARMEHHNIHRGGTESEQQMLSHTVTVAGRSRDAMMSRAPADGSHLVARHWPIRMSARLSDIIEYSNPPTMDRNIAANTRSTLMNNRINRTFEIGHLLDTGRD